LTENATSLRIPVDRITGSVDPNHAFRRIAIIPEMMAPLGCR
jgi:hypothetical protein